jgi:hypothetical protein
MARAFDTNQQINGVTTVARNQSAMSFASWMFRGASSTRQMVGFCETLQTGFLISHFSDNNYYAVVGGGGFQWGFVGANITGWNHFAFTFDGTQTGNSNRLKMYVNGGLQSPSFSGTIPSTTADVSNMEQFRIGRRVDSNLWSTGSFAEIGMWQATLTAEEVASLAKGMTCDKICPQSLVYYTPLIRDIQDLARGMTLTDTNSTVANHPRVYA